MCRTLWYQPYGHRDYESFLTCSLWLPLMDNQGKPCGLSIGMFMSHLPMGSSRNAYSMAAALGHVKHETLGVA